jgi:hypothetical protein
LIVLLAVIVMSFASVVSWLIIHRDIAQPDGTAADNSPIVTSRGGNADPKFTVDEPLFSFELPQDWELQAEQAKPYRYWIWKSTKEHADDKTLAVYVDGVPPQMAYSMLQPLTASGTGLALGSISDNCLNFTPDAAEAQRKNETRVVRWQGITFTCDIPSYTKPAIGTGSKDGMNKVTLTGPTSGKHDYFFLYIDLNIRPDNTIFTDALRSFKVK